MRKVIASEDEKELRKRIRDFWGIGAFRYRNMGGPCLKATVRELRERPAVPAPWLKMWTRYFRNWERKSFDRLSTDA